MTFLTKFIPPLFNKSVANGNIVDDISIKTTEDNDPLGYKSKKVSVL